VSNGLKRAVFVDGVRTPFSIGNTIYSDLIGERGNDF